IEFGRPGDQLSSGVSASQPIRHPDYRAAIDVSSLRLASRATDRKLLRDLATFARSPRAQFKRHGTRFPSEHTYQIFQRGDCCRRILARGAYAPAVRKI